MDLVLIKLYKINGSDSIFVIWDELVKFKEEDQSREKMRVYPISDARPSHLMLIWTELGVMCTLYKPHGSYVNMTLPTESQSGLSPYFFCDKYVSFKCR